MGPKDSYGLLVDAFGKRFRVVPEEDFEESAPAIRLSASEANLSDLGAKAFGDQLREAREAKNITQDLLETLSGVTQTAISRIEKKRAVPRESTKRKLLEAVERYASPEGRR